MNPNLKTDMAREAEKVMQECLELLDKKQQDYGSGNITIIGEPGVLMRTLEKTERLKRLITTKANPNYEAIEDSWKDIVNYAVIAILVRRNLWK